MPDATEVSEFTNPRTDLHTHFAGVLTAKRLIELGLEHDLKVDAKTIRDLKLVSYDPVPNEGVALRSLGDEQKAILEEAMSLNPEKQILPSRLNELYRVRKFVTDNREMFPHLIKAIAQDYAAQKVEYAELSYAGIVSSPELIGVIHKVLPEIEKETGVKIRFLAGIWRHADQEWNEDQIDCCKKILASPYVVGVDVMGFERNSIRHLKEPLRNLVAWAADHVPGFAMRIHAGESLYYSNPPAKINATTYNNLHESVEIFREGRALNPTGVYADQLQARIGHGRYGLFEETLKMMHEENVIVELCLSSNFVLNNAEDSKGPFGLFDKSGVPYLICTDGHGTYGTSQPHELALAREGGLTGTGV